MMRQKIVAGNWKMNLLHNEAMDLAHRLNNDFKNDDVALIIAPPALYLSEMAQKKSDHVHLAAQNCHSKESGAFTGEISVNMLASIGLPYAIIGHSERRMYFNESDDFISLKFKALQHKNITPIFCVGEHKEQRAAGKHFDVIKEQLNAVLSNEASKNKAFIVAYEPVWAIGTGLTASADQAQEMHAFIRNEIKENLGDNCANSTSILYGGSCKPENATELFACNDIDGGLIGGAALSAKSFIQIAQSF